MSEQDLNEFFGEFLNEKGQVPPEAAETFRRLINLTLEFRDSWKAETGEILTVGDTRKALDIYLRAMETGRVPSKMKLIIDRLIRFWMKNINGVDY